MGGSTTKLAAALQAIGMTSLLAAVSTVHAADASPPAQTSDRYVTWNNTVRHGAESRTRSHSQNPALLANANADDSDRTTLSQLRAGKSLPQAYYSALLFSGKVVLLTGCTLAIGVITWVASPIKFQADMSLLLAFMFLWNMLGALVLLPALAHLLLSPRSAQAAPTRGPLIQFATQFYGEKA